MLHIKWCGLFRHTSGSFKQKEVIEIFKGKKVIEAKSLIKEYVETMQDYGFVLDDQEIMDVWES